MDTFFLSLGERSLGGNSIESYAWAVGMFLVLWFLFFVVQRFFLARARVYSAKTKTELDDVAVHVVESFRPSVAIVLAAYFAAQSLSLGYIAGKIIDALFIIAVTYQVVSIAQVVVNFFVERAAKGQSDAHTRVAVKLLSVIVKGAVWIFAGLLVISNLGVNVTSLIAGVGIGGVAIAFALQNILKDLFSSFSLYFDKPFTVGDFIVIGQDSGTVKEIGIKTTRIKSLGGEEIIVPNSELTSVRIQNFKKMKRRRVSKTFGVEYDTSNEKLKRIPEIIKSALENIENVTFDRAHFNKFGDSALVFEYVYFVETADYTVYMDVHQAFNLELKTAFEREGIMFAYPTQTVYVKK